MIEGEIYGFVEKEKRKFLKRLNSKKAYRRAVILKIANKPNQTKLSL